MSARKKSQPGLAPITPIGANELELLRRAPYDHPYSVRGAHEVKLADALVAEGLLERDPSAPSFVRQTERGIEAARPLSSTRARLAVNEVRVAAFDEEDSEKATGLERALHARVLAEIASPPFPATTIDPWKHARELARIALTTASIEFRR